MSKHYSVGGWRQKTLARRESANTSPVLDVDLGDGCEFRGRRIDVQMWVKAGRMPQRLTEQIIRVHKGEQEQINEAELTAHDTIAALRFQRDLVCASFVEPVIIGDENAPLGDGEMYFSEAFADCPDWIDKVVNWQMQGAPGIPVPLDDGGETTLEALDTFRDGTRGEEPTSAGADVPELRTAAKPDTAVIG